MFHNSNGFWCICCQKETMEYANQVHLIFIYLNVFLVLCNALNNLKQDTPESDRSINNSPEVSSSNFTKGLESPRIEDNLTLSNASKVYLNSDIFKFIVNDLDNFNQYKEEENSDTSPDVMNKNSNQSLQNESHDLYNDESQTKGIWRLPPEFVASLNLDAMISSLENPSNTNKSSNISDTQRDESQTQNAWIPGSLAQHSLRPISVIESRSFVTNPEISSLRINYILAKAKTQKEVGNEHRRQYSSAEDPDSSSAETDFSRFLDEEYKSQIEKEAETMIKRKNSENKNQEPSSVEEKKNYPSPVVTEERKSPPNPVFRNHVFFFKGEENMFKDFFGFGDFNSVPKLHSEFHPSSEEVIPPFNDELLKHEDQQENGRDHNEFQGHPYYQTNNQKANTFKTNSPPCEHGSKSFEGESGSYEQSYKENSEETPPNFENINEPGPYYETHLPNPLTDSQSGEQTPYYNQGHPVDTQHKIEAIPYGQGSYEPNPDYNEGDVGQTPGYHQESDKPGYLIKTEPSYPKDSDASGQDHHPYDTSSDEDQPNGPSSEHSSGSLDYSKEEGPGPNVGSAEYTEEGNSLCEEEEGRNIEPQLSKVVTPAVHQYALNHQYQESHFVNGESRFQQRERKNPDFRTISNPYAFPMQREKIPRQAFREAPLSNIQLEGGFKPAPHVRTTVKPDCDIEDSLNSGEDLRHHRSPEVQRDISGEQWIPRNPVILPVPRLRHPILKLPQAFGDSRRERNSEVLTPQASSEQKSAEKGPKEEKKYVKKQTKSKLKKSRRRRHPKKTMKKKRSKRDHMKAEESSYHWGLENHKDMDGFFMYANIPGADKYEYGYRVGGPEHNLERHHKTGGRRSTIKLNWEDQNGDSGDQYWEFNHDDDSNDDRQKAKNPKHKGV